MATRRNLISTLERRARLVDAFRKSHPDAPTLMLLDAATEAGLSPGVICSVGGFSRAMYYKWTSTPSNIHPKNLVRVKRMIAAIGAALHEGALPHMGDERGIELSAKQAEILASYYHAAK